LLGVRDWGLGNRRTLAPKPKPKSPTPSYFGFRKRA